MAVKYALMMFQKWPSFLDTIKLHLVG